MLISIHAPCTGSDARDKRLNCGIPHFNPRSLHGERHTPACTTLCFVHFNPRSLHGERRPGRTAPTKMQSHFNPRSLHGERRLRLQLVNPRSQFQSTLPARGATASTAKRSYRSPFQSTLPARGATHLTEKKEESAIISIHAPCTGSD